MSASRRCATMHSGIWQRMPSHAHKRRRHAPYDALRVSKRAGASEPTCLSLRVGSDRQHVHATKDDRPEPQGAGLYRLVHSVVGGNRGECIVCARVGPNQSTAATHNSLLAYVLIVQGLTAILRPFGAPGSRPPTVTGVCEHPFTAAATRSTRRQISEPMRGCSRRWECRDKRKPEALPFWGENPDAVYTFF